MEQEVEENRTVRNLAESVEVFLYATIFAFALEGLLLIYVLIYNMFFYRFFAWIQWHECIGMVITYTFFIVILVIMLHFIHKTLHFSNRSVQEVIPELWHYIPLSSQLHDFYGIMTGIHQ
jgi:hypothetical protein